MELGKGNGNSKQETDSTRRIKAGKQVLYIPRRNGLRRDQLCEELLFLPRMSPLVDLSWLEKRAGAHMDLAAPSPSPRHLLECGAQQLPRGKDSDAVGLCVQGKGGLNLCCVVHSYSIEIREYWAKKEPITDLCDLNTHREHPPSPDREQPVGGLAPCSPKGHSSLCLGEGVRQKRAVLVSEGKKRLQHVLASFLKQIF